MLKKVKISRIIKSNKIISFERTFPLDDFGAGYSSMDNFLKGREKSGVLWINIG